MYSINYTHQFKKDMRKCVKRGLDFPSLQLAAVNSLRIS